MLKQPLNYSNLPQKIKKKKCMWAKSTSPMDALILGQLYNRGIHKTNSSPTKIGRVPKGKQIFQPSIFRFELLVSGGQVYSKILLQNHFRGMLVATSHHPFFGPFQKSKKKRKNRTKVQAFVHRRSKKRQVVSSFQDLKAKPQLGSKAKTAAPEVTGVKNTPFGGSIPASVWVVTPIYKHFIPFGRGTLLRGTYEYYETWLLATY